MVCFVRPSVYNNSLLTDRLSLPQETGFGKTFSFTFSVRHVRSLRGTINGPASIELYGSLFSFSIV